MKRIVCFIDDSDFEHDLVRNELAVFAPDLDFIQTRAFDEARENLGAREPSLFLLDLWGQDQTVKESHIISKVTLEKKAASFPTLNDVYMGLDQFKGNLANEYLKRLFIIVNSWRDLFEDACNQIGQNRKYGLYNLKMARTLYPRTPAVFYTRKSLITDAVAMFRAGADGLFIKPTGADENETRGLTREYAPQLITELKRIMTAKLKLTGF
jgi:DNA-binding NarL/FixJ family response regulator